MVSYYDTCLLLFSYKYPTFSLLFLQIVSFINPDKIKCTTNGTVSLSICIQWSIIWFFGYYCRCCWNIPLQKIHVICSWLSACKVVFLTHSHSLLKHHLNAFVTTKFRFLKYNGIHHAQFFGTFPNWQTYATISFSFSWTSSQNAYENVCVPINRRGSKYFLEACSVRSL